MGSRSRGEFGRMVTSTGNLALPDLRSMILVYSRVLSELLSFCTAVDSEAKEITPDTIEFLDCLISA